MERGIKKKNHNIHQSVRSGPTLWVLQTSLLSPERGPTAGRLDGQPRDACPAL